MPSPGLSVVHASLQNSYMKALISNVIIFGGGTSGKWLGFDELIKVEVTVLDGYFYKKRRGPRQEPSGESTAKTPPADLAFMVFRTMAVSVCCLTHPLFGNFGVEIQTDQDCSPSLYSPIKTTPIWHWLLYNSQREEWVRCRVCCWSCLLLYSHFNQTKCYTIAPNLLIFEFTCSLSSVLAMFLHSLPCWPCFLHHLLPIQDIFIF